MALHEFLELRGQDAYQILGLTPLATPTDIRSARRTRQKAVHPDRHGDAELSKLVNYAAQILLDDQLRREYDEFRRRGVAPVPGMPTQTGPPPAETTAPPPGPPPAPAGASSRAAEFGAPGRRSQSSGSIVLIALVVVAGLAFCIGCTPWGRLVTDLF